MEYPKRDSHFAHKAFRLLHKTCFAATDGLDAFALIAVIVHTEDAARYSGPVSFWNSQLQETLGFAKWERLDRARKSAVKSGWLNYSSTGHRKIGQYFVTIPEGCGSLSDTVIESCYPSQGYQDGYQKGYQDGYLKREQERDGQGYGEGDGQGYGEGEPSIPTPFPGPTIYAPGSDITIPEKVNHPMLRAAVGRWVAYLHAEHPDKAPLSNSQQEQAMWSTLNRWQGSVEDIESRIDECIMGNWQNLRPPEAPKQTRGNGKPKRVKLTPLDVGWDDSLPDDQIQYREIDPADIPF
jgi:hypothetical protein